MTIPGNLISTLFANTVTSSAPTTTVSPATWSLGDKSPYSTLTNNRLTVTAGFGNGWQSVRATKGNTSGKWYWEVTIASNVAYQFMGIGDSNASLESYVGASGNSIGFWSSAGAVYKQWGGATFALPTNLEVLYTTPQTYMFALDLDNHKFYIGRNGVWGNSANPVAGTGWVMTDFSGEVFPMASGQNGSSLTANFGQSAFQYTVPTGFNSSWGTEIVVTAAPTAAPDSYASSNALLLHFDGSITDVSPQSVFPRSVQLNGGAQLTTAVKKFGTGSLDLTVTGSNVTISAGAVPMFNPANTYTVEGWYNTSYAGGSLPLVTGNANDFYIVNIANTWYCGDGATNPITVQSSSVGTAGQWHHFACSFDASSGFTRFFLDGVKVGETSNRMKNVEITSVTFGQLQGVYNRVDGYIDDIRITVGIARYTGNFTPPTAAFPNA